MAVTRVSSQFANGDTLAMPSHQKHDLLIAVVYRHTSTIAPTMPLGWRLRAERRASNNGGIGIYERIAASGSELFGIWTNATQVACIVYRSNDNKLLSTSGGADTFGTSTTINYSAVSQANLLRFPSFVLGACGIRSNTSNAEGAPSGMTNIGSVAGVSDGELTVHDTNAEVAQWTSTSFTASTSESYVTCVMGIQETTHPVPTGGGGASAYGFYG